MLSAIHSIQPVVRAAAARRANLPIRVGSAFVVAAGLHLLLDLAWAWLWLAIYVAVQAVEHLVAKPLLDHPDAPVSGARQAVFFALIFLTSAVFGSLAVPLYTSGNVYDPSVATLLLTGGVLNVVVVNSVCRSAVLIGAAPHILYLLAGPFLATGGQTGGNHWLAWWGGVCLLVAASAAAALRLEGAMRAETDAKALAQARQQEAETAVEAKNAFVAMISHELRTPISAILAGAAELAKDDHKPQARATQARLVGDSGRMMRALLDDLLDMAKLDAQRMEVETIPFDLRLLLLDVTRMWRPPMREKGLRLRLEGAASIPGWVEGDPTRIRQVLNNLISNAIKFTRAGSVTLRLHAEPGPTGHRIVIGVADTGAGMSEDQLARLFTPFDQLGAGTARKHGGSGLGLFISRQLARLMGGDLVAFSPPPSSSSPGGALFELSLTLPIAEARAAELAPACAEAPDVAQLKVLVVDDHAVNRQAVALMLAPAGVVPIQAASAEEALDILAAEPFDVILMDVYMPDLDGREAARRIRAAAGPNQRTPIIAVTASATPKDWEACQGAGMTGHVAKPIDPAALYAALEAAVAGPAQGQAVTAA